MKIPKKIKFKVILNNESLNNIICFIQLITNKKNDYSLGSFKTDDSGEFYLLKEDIEEKMKKEQEAFPMDYTGNINDAYQLRIMVENTSDLRKRLERIKKYYPISAKKLNDQVKNSNNSTILESLTLEYPIQELILLEINQVQ